MKLRLVDPIEDHAGPTQTEFDKIGAYLRAVREHRSLTLDKLAETTRIGKTYLQAIEDGDFSALPSRPFATGYVRSYAMALGSDGEAAAARFKSEAPDLSEPLRNPIGVKHETRRHNPLIFSLVGLVILGVVLWNVTQHSMAPAERAAPLMTLSGAQAAEAKAPQGPISLGAATPPPADQTTPVAYVTPGMDTSGAQGSGTTKTVTAPLPTTAAAPSSYASATVFVPKGAVYGAPEATPAVVLQAKKATALIVRGAGGAVYFARQLAPGEAYRAPIGAGLSADIADPGSFDVYVKGVIQTAPAPGQTAVDKLADTPAPKAAA